jgi:hypothetical protein
MVKVRSLSLECLTTGHLETEEGAHRLLGSIGILLSLYLLIRRSSYLCGLDNWLRKCCSLTLLRGSSNSFYYGKKVIYKPKRKIGYVLHNKRLYSYSEVLI